MSKPLPTPTQKKEVRAVSGGKAIPYNLRRFTRVNTTRQTRDNPRVHEKEKDPQPVLIPVAEAAIGEHMPLQRLGNGLRKVTVNVDLKKQLGERGEGYSETVVDGLNGSVVFLTIRGVRNF